MLKMLNKRVEEAEVIRVASEIRRYLDDHPESADSIDGITRWWLPRQRIEESTLLVQQALDYLVSESLVERKASRDGDHLYFSAKQSRNDEK